MKYYMNNFMMICVNDRNESILNVFFQLYLFLIVLISKWITIMTIWVGMSSYQIGMS